MITFLNILLFLACFIIIAAVLLQPAKSGVSALGGTSQSIFGSTGGTTFLFRVTMGAAFFIMVACLFISWNKIHQGRASFVDATLPVSGATSPLTNPTAPVAPQAPAAPSAPAQK